FPLDVLAQQQPDRTASDCEASAADLITQPTQTVIDRGLAFLAARQNDDGSFGASGYSRNVAISGLAGMAFMSSGSTPGRGMYGENVERCVKFVLASAQESGFISINSAAIHGPMYGH